EFSRPVYFGLKALKRDILGGVTGRDALSVAIRAADHVYRQPGGPELLQNFYRDLQTTAPSEMVPLFAELPDAQETIEQATPPVAEEPTEVVNLKRECSVNGERFAPGRHVVPASKAAALRAIDVGRG